MTIHNTEGNANESNRNKVSKRKKYERPERHIKRVDFQRVEESPNPFEKQVQRKIAISPSPLAVLLERERQETIKAVLEKIIQESGLSDSELRCIRLQLKDLKFMEIARRMKLGKQTIHTLFARAMSKMKAYVAERKTEYDAIRKDLFCSTF